MKNLPVIAFLLLPIVASGQAPKVAMTRIATPAQADAIPLYPAASLAPGSVSETWDMVSVDFPDGRHVDGRIVRNVSIPTISPVLPEPSKATGAAVVVAPGGGFWQLTMDAEGFAVAHWLADRGIAAFVLKYRLNNTPTDEAAFQATTNQRMDKVIRSGGSTQGIGEPNAYADALASLKLIRANASKWHVDARRVGMIGFSAGAMTIRQASLTAQNSEGPAFVGYIYGPMVAVDVPATAPPLFAAIALDDPLFGKQGFGIIEAWHKAGIPVELHAYERGFHGFGTGAPGTTTTLVMDEFRLWLETGGFLSAKGKT
jgi:acetyl esterase/lipase